MVTVTVRGPHPTHTQFVWGLLGNPRKTGFRANWSQIFEPWDGLAQVWCGCHAQEVWQTNCPWEAKFLFCCQTTSQSKNGRSKFIVISLTIFESCKILFKNHNNKNNHICVFLQRPPQKCLCVFFICIISLIFFGYAATPSSVIPTKVSRSKYQFVKKNVAGLRDVSW